MSHVRTKRAHIHDSRVPADSNPNRLRPDLPKHIQVSLFDVGLKVFYAYATAISQGYQTAGKEKYQFASPANNFCIGADGFPVKYDLNVQSQPCGGSLDTQGSNNMKRGRDDYVEDDDELFLEGADAPYDDGFPGSSQESACIQGKNQQVFDSVYGRPQVEPSLTQEIDQVDFLQSKDSLMYDTRR